MRLADDKQRLWDLVRHQRADLHTAELITDNEYFELAADHAAVARLEDYDAGTTGQPAYEGKSYRSARAKVLDIGYCGTCGNSKPECKCKNKGII